MYWIAKNLQDEILVLTEREALTHFEKNNISQRMRLRFLGTTDGKNTAEAKNKVKQIIISNRPDNFSQLEKGEQNVVDFQIRQKHLTEIKEIMDLALEADIEDAKQNGVKEPRSSIRIHTMSKDGHSRDKILGSMNGMV